MSKKRTYGTVNVERFDLMMILQLLTVGCIVAIDAAKTKFVAAFATAAGEVLKLVQFEHPRQTRAFLALIEALREAKLEPHVVLEPTGTYGDAVRHQCHRLGVPVHMMPPKHTHDMREVLDGVPSMHDAKAAVVLAKLQAIKPARAWVPETEARRDMRAIVDRRWPTSKTLALYHGQLEAMLARHWPELGMLIDVHEQRSWMALLKEFPGPGAVAASIERAEKTLWSASRGRLGSTRISTIIDAARTTLGVPMTNGEQAKLRAIVEQIEQQSRSLDATDKEIGDVVAADEMTRRLADVVGPACAASIASQVGTPLDFESASAFEKAMGLNLKEQSSGKKIGQLTITKRGPAQVRQLLYLAALRMINTNTIVLAWYRGRGAHRAGLKRKAVVAVMRKLARALWHVGRGSAFDATKLFDVRRLDLTSVVAPETHDDAPSTQHDPTRTQNATTPSQKKASLRSKKPNEGGVAQQLA